MDEPSWKLDDYSLKPLSAPPHRLIDSEELESQDYTLAVTGDVFRWIINHAPLETMQRVGARPAASDISANLPLIDARQDANLRTHVP